MNKIIFIIISTVLILALAVSFGLYVMAEQSAQAKEYCDETYGGGNWRWVEIKPDVYNCTPININYIEYLYNKGKDGVYPGSDEQ
jgi:hypothetical protein